MSCVKAVKEIQFNETLLSQDIMKMGNYNQPMFSVLHIHDLLLTYLDDDYDDDKDWENSNFMAQLLLILQKLRENIWTQQQVMFSTHFLTFLTIHEK